MQGAAAVTLAVGAPGLLGLAAQAQGKVLLPPVRKSPYGTSEPMNSFKDITNYNNFYEFGTDKYSPAQRAKSLRTRPWTVKVSGEVKRQKTFDVDELIKLAPLEECIYRLRCVEGWSMVIPWVGFPLAELIKRVEPTGNAYVEFTTPTTRSDARSARDLRLARPYVEHGEAMPLLPGLYGGAPTRTARRCASFP